MVGNMNVLDVVRHTLIIIQLNIGDVLFLNVV